MEKPKLEKPPFMSEESSEINEEKLRVIEYLRSKIEKSEDILSARIYGSWLYSEKSTDLDVCIIIPSDNGIVDPNTYKRLKNEREKLSENSAQDVDLVPHTSDEITDFRSGLYNPRYNPSLISGYDIKGKTEIEPISNKDEHFTYSDLVANILLDNRTVCRRQIIRSLSTPESKVFASKILHGPGNALTYHACKEKLSYLASPSNLIKSLKLFDQTYKVDSAPANEFLQSCRNNLNTEKALLLLGWYECLVALVLYDHKNAQSYRNYCLKMSHFNIKNENN
jgi:predicted nucleotidyltransferase